LSGLEQPLSRDRDFDLLAATRLRSTIAEVITELVTPLTAIGSCDIVTDVAQKYPIPIICALLGTDRADWNCPRTGPTTS
jgi:cytochrome P450